MMFCNKLKCFTLFCYSNSQILKREGGESSPAEMCIETGKLRCRGNVATDKEGATGSDAQREAKAVLGEAWLEQDDALGPQLDALHEVFGESLVQFVPTPVLCMLF